MCVKEAVYAHQYVFNIMPSHCLDGNHSSMNIKQLYYIYMSKLDANMEVKKVDANIGVG